MYKFVDTTESATNHSLSLKTVFNDHILDEVLTDETGSFITLTVNGRGDLMNKINLIELSNFDGLLEQGGPNLDSREIIVKFKLYEDRKSTRLNSSHVAISYAVFCLKKKIKKT